MSLGRDRARDREEGTNTDNEHEPRKGGGDQIEYEDEDPKIREEFEAALAKAGVSFRMAGITLLFSEVNTRKENFHG